MESSCDDNNQDHDSDKDGENDDDDDKMIQPEKKLSPLAMAAADWLEEEEDEWGRYWETYETYKQDKDKKPNTNTNSENTYTNGIGNRTTEELLDDYYETMGIDKKTERNHREEIETALKFARSQKSSLSSNNKHIIQALEQVRPFLQPNTQLGGQTLMELAIAYNNNNNDDDGDDDDESFQKAQTILQSILQKNRDRSLLRQAKQLLAQIENGNKDSPKKGFFGFNFDSW